MCQNNVESTAALKGLHAVSILGTSKRFKCFRQGRKKNKLVNST